MTSEVKPIKTQDDTENQRIHNLQRNPASWTKDIGSHVKKLAPYVGKVFQAINFVTPYVEKVIAMLVYLHSVLPMDVLSAIFGLILCFFGGTFAVSIAAYEAFMMVGYQDSKVALLYLYSEFVKVKNSYIQDDQKDDDGNGVPDVQEISTEKLIQRKALVFFSSVEDPEKITEAWGGVVSGFMAVLATLKIEFAKVITLGVAIGNTLRKPLAFVMAPVLGQLLGEEYGRWTNVIINSTAKLIAISIAWNVQKVVSAFHSAIKGGLIFSRHIIVFLNKKGLISINHEDTYLDEVVGWGIALVGFWFQLSNFFALPFPWNVLLFPLTIIEWVLIWLIS